MLSALQSCQSPGRQGGPAEAETQIGNCEKGKQKGSMREVEIKGLPAVLEGLASSIYARQATVSVSTELFESA